MRALVVVTLVLAACGGAPAPATPTPSAGSATPTVPADGSLYRRLGGYDAIAAVVDDFLGRWLADPVLAPFFEHLDGDGKAHVRQMVVDQLCAATGGPCLYLGLDMATAHEDLAIAAGDWNVAMQHLLATLDKFGVPARERRELDDILRSVRADVVRGNGTP